MNFVWMGLTYSLGCGEPWDRNVKQKRYWNIFFSCFIHIVLNMYNLFNWSRVRERESYLDYIELNYLSYSYKVLNPDAILYLHTSLNHLFLSNLNTFHIITLHSQSSLLKPSHLCYYHNKSSLTTLRLTTNSVGLAARFCTSNESSTELGEFWPCQIL